MNKLYVHLDYVWNERVMDKPLKLYTINFMLAFETRNWSIQTMSWPVLPPEASFERTTLRGRTSRSSRSKASTWESSGVSSSSTFFSTFTTWRLKWANFKASVNKAAKYYFKYLSFTALIICPNSIRNLPNGRSKIWQILNIDPVKVVQVCIILPFLATLLKPLDVAKGGNLYFW